MPFKFTYLDAKNSGPLKTVAGVCPDSDSFRDLINEVQETLWRRGEWWDASWICRLCAFNQCLTWPRWVKTVMGLRINGNPTQMQNKWFAVTGRGYNQGNPGGGCGAGYGGGTWSAGGYGYGWGGGANWGGSFDAFAQTRPWNVVIDSNTVPTYRDITGSEGKLIRYYVRNRPDVGKTITIFGLGVGNAPLQEQVDGVWREGITITAAAPFGTSSVRVTKITSVVREATSGMGYLYSYDPTSGDLIDLAQYEPTETNPRYRRSNIAGYCNNVINRGNSDDETKRGHLCVEALVKLDFIPVVSDNDFMTVDVFRAIKLGIQAVKLEEQNQDGLARAKWLEAIEEMNMEDRDRIPDDQTVVVESVIGGGALLSPS